MAKDAVSSRAMDHLASVAAIVGFVALAFAWYKFQFGKNLERLDHWADRKEIKSELFPRTNYKTYQRKMIRFTRFLDRTFGTPISWKAFDRSLLIAFIYPIILFAIAWLFGASGILNKSLLLPEEQDNIVRANTVGLLLLQSGLVWLVISKVRWGTSKLAVVQSSLWGNFLNRQDPINIALKSVLKTCTFLITSLIAVAMAFLVAIATAVSMSGAGIVAIVFAGASVVAVATISARYYIGMFSLFGTVSGAVAFTAAGAAVSVENVAQSASIGSTYILFFAALPLANALADWISWASTRWFISRSALRKSRKWRLTLVTLELLSDAIVAILCLSLLAVILPQVIGIANQLFIFIGANPVDWRTMLEQTSKDPWGQGLFIVLMLGTTLLPTLTHLAIGIGAMFLTWWSGNGAHSKLLIVGESGQRWETICLQPDPTGHQPTQSHANKIAHFQTIKSLWWIPGSLSSVLFITALVWFSYTFASTFGLLLISIAFWSGNLFGIA